MRNRLLGRLAVLGAVLLSGCAKDSPELNQLRRPEDRVPPQDFYVVGRDTMAGVVCYKHHRSIGISCVKVKP